MLIIENFHGSKGYTEIRAEVPHFKAPKIIAEKIIDGIKYYFGENGKQYIADRFDAFFKSAVRLKMKGRYHKGNLIGKGGVWQ